MKLDFYQINCFADKLFSGNPACVVPCKFLNVEVRCFARTGMSGYLFQVKKKCFLLVHCEPDNIRNLIAAIRFQLSYE